MAGLDLGSPGGMERPDAQVSLLPHVSDEVIKAMRDEQEHPVTEQWVHFAVEQDELVRAVTSRAALAESLSGHPEMDKEISVGDAFKMGAMYTYGSLREQATRNKASAMEVAEPARHFEPVVELVSQRRRSSMIVRIGGAAVTLLTVVKHSRHTPPDSV